jgi:hypothetical protein
VDVSNLFGKISVLAMFIVKPEHSLKICKILLNLDRSLAVGAENIATSPYREHLSFVVFGRTGWWNPFNFSSHFNDALERVPASIHEHV